ncbi:WXG100 family type VII secretion target [Saccharopolyspora sp. 5N708]|uniref:WXG100 family type VII secretion target n=1 Tax=Saccharopolyspora sp. 5N708 TaxID=3457424 RepID=UPI003FD347CC
MAQPVVQTSQPGMQQAGQIFSDRAADFTTESQRINDMMASLRSTWTGNASNNFNQAMDAWSASFQVIIEKLNNMRELMGINAKDYVAAEDDSSTAAQSFATALPGV